MARPLGMLAAASLPADLGDAVERALEEARRAELGPRLWARDAALWTGRDEGRWLGWLDIVRTELAAAGELDALAAAVRGEAFTRALLLGMGGSSLGPEVLAGSFGPQAGYPELHILDSTDPAQVRSCAARVADAPTLFVVASKSGTTLEPTLFLEYFHAQAVARWGSAAGQRFVAITDPGSRLEAEARALGFRHVFHGVPAIGGRYSVLSRFGMVPAAIMGLDHRRFLERAQAMVAACAAAVPPAENPGLALGLLLGVMAAHGRNKVTFIASPELCGLGAWLEQLLAESTGKDGQALVPVDREPLAEPAAYGEDRLFVHLAAGPGTDEQAAVAALERAGQPVIRLEVASAMDLGGEFFRWQVATAVAGSVLGLNPFDQPDVEASKVATRELTAEFERTGVLPAEEPFLASDGVRLFADRRNAAELERERSLAGVLRAHLGRIQSHDYCAFLAYIEMNAEHEAELTAMRVLVRDAKRVATCVGFGPRFLHSTGQAYKGGPPSGVFLQITADDAHDLPVPERRLTFGAVKAAQARGDFAVLAARDRRALRVHLGPDVPAGLATLRRALARALA